MFHRKYCVYSLLVLILFLCAIIYFKQEIVSGRRSREALSGRTIRVGAGAKEDNTLLPAVYEDDRQIMTSASMDLDLIPRILHIQWRDDMIPEFAVPFVKSWLKHHPHIKVMLWTDQQMNRLVQNLFKETKIAAFYSKFPAQIYRVDFTRYIILYHFGGIYADLDVSALTSLEPMLNYHSCVIAREPEPYLVSLGKDTSLLASNVLMISRPYHPFWPFLINSIVKIPYGGPLEWVGPIAVTSALEQYHLSVRQAPIRDCVFLAPTIYFYPPTNPKGDQMHLNMLATGCKQFGDVQKANAFVKRICTTFEKEKRIDWQDLYLHPRHFKTSFTRHHQYNSWNGATLNDQKKVPIIPIIKERLQDIKFPQSLAVQNPFSGQTQVQNRVL